MAALEVEEIEAAMARVRQKARTDNTVTEGFVNFIINLVMMQISAEELNACEMLQRHRITRGIWLEQGLGCPQIADVSRGNAAATLLEFDCPWVPDVSQEVDGVFQNSCLPRPEQKGNDTIILQPKDVKEGISAQRIKDRIKYEGHPKYALRVMKQFEGLLHAAVAQQMQSYGPPTCTVAGDLDEASRISFGLPPQSLLKQHTDKTMDDMPEQIPGVQFPYIWVSGKGNSSFGCASIAAKQPEACLGLLVHLARGAPMLWVIIGPEHAKRAREYVVKGFPGQNEYCSEDIGHRNVWIPCRVLEELGVPYRLAWQQQGELLVIGPGTVFYGCCVSCEGNALEFRYFTPQDWPPKSYDPCGEACRHMPHRAAVNAQFASDPLPPSQTKQRGKAPAAGSEPQSQSQELEPRRSKRTRCEVNGGDPGGAAGHSNSEGGTSAQGDDSIDGNDSGGGDGNANDEGATEESINRQDSEESLFLDSERYEKIQNAASMAGDVNFESALRFTTQLHSRLESRESRKSLAMMFWGIGTAVAVEEAKRFISKLDVCRREVGIGERTMEFRDRANLIERYNTLEPAIVFLRRIHLVYLHNEFVSLHSRFIYERPFGTRTRVPRGNSRYGKLGEEARNVFNKHFSADQSNTIRRLMHLASRLARLANKFTPKILLLVPAQFDGEPLISDRRIEKITDQSFGILMEFLAERQSVIQRHCDEIGKALPHDFPL